MYAVVTVYISQSRVWNRWNFISIFFPRTWRAPPCARKVIDNKNTLDPPTLKIRPAALPLAKIRANLNTTSNVFVHLLYTLYTHHTGAAVQVKLVVASRSGLAARSSSRASKNCLSICICLQSVCLDLVEGRCTMPAAPLDRASGAGWLVTLRFLLTHWYRPKYG